MSQIFDYDPDGFWLVSQLVRPLNSDEDFEKLTGGIDWEAFQYAVQTFLYEARGDFKKAADELEFRASRRNSDHYAEVLLKALSYLKTNKWVRNFLKMAKKYDLLPEDLTFLDHWGKTADGRVVLLDYGYTALVHDLHY